MLIICKHQRVYTSDITNDRVFYEMLMCRNCGAELARWEKPEEGKFCFEREMFRRQFVFGKPFQLSLSLLAELR